MTVLKENTLVLTPDAVSLLEKYATKINKAPEKEEIKVNEKANNSLYIPISDIQMALDEEYFGLWNFRLSYVQVIANEIIGYGELSVFHPIAHIWLTRSGSAAVMIQQKSQQSGGSGDITNISDKIKNTLVKDFPHLEAEILKSAAKKLGKRFGRDLNRAFEDTYQPEFTLSVTLDEILPQLKECKTIDGIKELWAKYPELQKSNKFKTAFTARRKELE